MLRQNTWDGGIEGVLYDVAIGKPLDKVVFMQSSAIEILLTACTFPAGRRFLDMRSTDLGVLA